MDSILAINYNYALACLGNKMENAEATTIIAEMENTESRIAHRQHCLLCFSSIAKPTGKVLKD